MKRIAALALFFLVVLSLVPAGAALATPVVNGATIELRTFNDCPLSTVTTTNNYPASISITDAISPLCVGFANLHSFSFSADGGVTAAVFNNNSNFRLGADFMISGLGEGEGGLRISPWYGQFVDGRFMVNATTGEIACFGGSIPFYSFTVNHGITYVKGTVIHLEMSYQDHDLTPANPATIQYRVIYNGTTYESPVLPFGSQNPNECEHGLYGMLNDGRVGGYFQPRADTGKELTATWTNIEFACLPADGTPAANGAIVTLRTFNDCPLSTVTTANNYPASVSIKDEMSPLCVGFANLHSFSFSEDGGATAAEFDNNANFRFGADFMISGAGEGEGGLRISPWYGQFVDGRFMVNATTGEIACFGGSLPFYSFTVNHGITYTKGSLIHLEMAYQAVDLTAANPATMQYRVIYNGTTYDSPVLPFGEQNPNECAVAGVYHGLWGMLNDGRAGGYFQPRADTGKDLTATWTNITYSRCAVQALVEFNPHTLNLASHGKWVTVTVEPVGGASAADIDVSSLLLNGSVAVDPAAPAQLGDADSDGIPDLTVKFPRADVVALLSAGNDVTISITGVVGCDCLEGTDHIRVRNSALKAPAAGSVLSPGARLDVVWKLESRRPTVDLISSFDAGATWKVEARDIANTGRFSWTVPDVGTNRALLAVVQIARVTDSGIVSSVEVGESGLFTIGSLSAVGERNVASLALERISPNASRGGFTVTFSLPADQAAKLAVFDVTGRQVASFDVGEMGAGEHTVKVGENQRLAAGIYMIRLGQNGRSVTGKAVVTR